MSFSTPFFGKNCFRIASESPRRPNADYANSWHANRRRCRISSINRPSGEPCVGLFNGSQGFTATV
jgi:hypothetical protein